MLDHFLTDVVDIYQPTEAAASDTGWIGDEYSLAAAGVPCSVQPVSGDYLALMQGEVIQQTRNVFFKPDANVAEDSYLLHGSVWYRVTSVANMANHHLEVIAKRAEAPTMSAPPPPPPPPGP